MANEEVIYKKTQQLLDATRAMRTAMILSKITKNPEEAAKYRKEIELYGKKIDKLFVQIKQLQ